MYAIYLLFLLQIEKSYFFRILHLEALILGSVFLSVLPFLRWGSKVLTLLKGEDALDLEKWCKVGFIGFFLLLTNDY